MEEYHFESRDIGFQIRTPSNKMQGEFILYQTSEDSIDTSFQVRVLRRDEANISFRVKSTEQSNDRNSTFRVVIKEDSDVSTTFEVVGSSTIETNFFVRPNNRLYGAFEILPPPRSSKDIISTADSTTRSRFDLMTINYGDSQRMMIGSSEGEHYESFIRFDGIIDQTLDMSVLEKANLRINYTGDFRNDTNIQLFIPKTRWTEFGITHANKPETLEMVSNQYLINKQEKYIEFEIIELLKQWRGYPEYNYGLVIKSDNNYATSFYTREGRYQPSINVTYITTGDYSVDRDEAVSTFFVYGVGDSEHRSFFTVHSDYGFEDHMSSFYIHRPEVPLEEDLNTYFTVTKPDYPAKFIVARREFESRETLFWVRNKSLEDEVLTFVVSKPQQHSFFVVDPNISRKTFFHIARNEQEDSFINFNVSRPDYNTYFNVKYASNIDTFFEVAKDEENDLSSHFSVSRKDSDVLFKVRAYEEYDQDTVFSVRVEDKFDQSAYLDVSRPTNAISFNVRTLDEKYHTLNFSVSQTDFELHAAKFNITRPEHEVNFKVRVVKQDDNHTCFYVAKTDSEDHYIGFSVSRPIHDTLFTVRSYEEIERYTYLNVARTEFEDRNSYLAVSRKEIQSTFYTRVYEEIDQDVTFDVPFYDWHTANFTVHEFNEQKVSFMVHQVTDHKTELAVSRPDHSIFFKPRAVGYEDQFLTLQIRQRDAGDKEIYFSVKGRIGAYYIII